MRLTHTFRYTCWLDETVMLWSAAFLRANSLEPSQAFTYMDTILNTIRYNYEKIDYLMDDDRRAEADFLLSIMFLVVCDYFDAAKGEQ